MRGIHGVFSVYSLLERCIDVAWADGVELLADVGTTAGRQAATFGENHGVWRR